MTKCLVNENSKLHDLSYNNDDKFLLFDAFPVLRVINNKAFSNLLKDVSLIRHLKLKQEIICLYRFQNGKHNDTITVEIKVLNCSDHKLPTDILKQN